eukprot:829047-Alexandrium_andersonii.AAC.1
MLGPQQITIKIPVEETVYSTIWETDYGDCKPYDRLAPSMLPADSGEPTGSGPFVRRDATL